MGEVQKKYKNRETFNISLPGKFLLIWYQFLYLIEGDKEKSKAKLQKPKEFKSFVIRRQILKYVRDNWYRFNALDFEDWCKKNLKKDLVKKND